jgi:hypothetical protein
MTEHHHWRKSSYSVGTQNCVELADNGDALLVRDSKHPTGGHLSFTRSELAALVAAAKVGELDDLT